MEIHFPDGMTRQVCAKHEFKSKTHKQQKEIFACVTYIFVSRGFYNKNGHFFYSKNRLSDKRSNMRVKEQSGFVIIVNDYQ